MIHFELSVEILQNVGAIYKQNFLKNIFIYNKTTPLVSQNI
jgi:hypothetical protein